jgi:hypothetical protein
MFGIKAKVIEEKGKGCWNVTLPFRLCVGDIVRVGAWHYIVKEVVVNIESAEMFVMVVKETT